MRTASCASKPRPFSSRSQKATTAAKLSLADGRPTVRVKSTARPLRSTSPTLLPAHGMRTPGISGRKVSVMSNQLPERASLDYLKRRAKDKLGELRAGDPSAKLADAQLAI